MEKKLERTGVAILISEKNGLKTKIIIREKEGYFMLIKGSIHQEDIKLKTYMHLNTEPQIHEQRLTELKGEIGNSIVINGDYNTPLSIMIRETREMINRVTEDLNN